MTLSVVIPTLNEGENLQTAIESAQALQPGWGGEVQVVVADGGSEDQTTAIARSLGVRLITTARGRGRQLRAGVEASRGEVILMLHADTKLAPEAGQQLREALRDERVGCGAFQQKIDAPGVAYRMLEAGNAFRARRRGMPYGDQAIFVRRSLLEAVGGVEPLPLMEDVDLMQRLRRQSRPVLLPGPLVVSARRWRRHGVVGQTLRNWSILVSYWMGASPEDLAKRYAAHSDAKSD